MKPQNITRFVKIIGQSKKIKRTGWVREKVKNPESVADHSFRLIVLCMTLADVLKVDQNKLIKMAIIHDLGETKTGDIVVERGRKIFIKKRLKREKIEEEAIKELLNVFGEEYHQIFHELIERKSREAKVFWQLDKLEMAFQAKEYEDEQGKDLREFFENADINISDRLLRKTLLMLTKR